MKTVKLDSVGYLHAGPTCGKSTLVANALKQGIIVIDNDPIIFGFLMTNQMQSKLSSSPKGSPWYAKGDDRDQWRIVERASGILVQILAEQLNATIITNNLSGDVRPKDVFNNTYSFFREPSSMAAMLEARAIAKGKSEKKDYAKIAKGWFDGWSSHHADYDHVITLKEDEYLCDFFGVKPDVLDPKEVEAIIYQFMYSKMEELNWFNTIKPGKRESTTKAQSDATIKAK